MTRTRPNLISAGYTLFALAAGCIVLLIARHNRLTFPYPWNDEARFYLPAWNFANTGSLNPQILNAPNGIYWVPDGFYVWIGTFLALFGRSIAVARLVCELSVAASVSIFALSFKRITQSASMGILVTLVLLTPPVIFAANMVRMESVLCLLFAAAIWLHLHRAYTAAASLLLLSILFHPAFTIALAAYLITLYATPHSNNPAHWQTIAGRLLLTIVLLALTAEIVRVLSHLQLFHHHMAYQAARKDSRSYSKLLIKPQGILLLAELTALLTWLSTQKKKFPEIELLPIAAATLGMQLYAVLGGEGAYDVYSLSLGPAIFLALAYRLTSPPPAEPQTPPA